MTKLLFINREFFILSSPHYRLRVVGDLKRIYKAVQTLKIQVEELEFALDYFDKGHNVAEFGALGTFIFSKKVPELDRKAA